jgi:hypothetical protein
MKQISVNNVYLILTNKYKFNGKLDFSEVYNKMSLYIFNFHHLSYVISRLKFRRLHTVDLMRLWMAYGLLKKNPAVNSSLQRVQIKWWSIHSYR